MTITNDTQSRWFTAYVRSLMSALLERPAEPDGDGDIAVDGETSRCWVRADVREPWGVQVFAYAAYGVPARAAVLKELNQINTHYPGIKVALLESGIVIVDYRLFADAVNEETLRTCVKAVITIADEIGPMLAAVHGGETPYPLELSGTEA